MVNCTGRNYKLFFPSANYFVAGAKKILPRKRRPSQFTDFASIWDNIKRTF